MSAGHWTAGYCRKAVTCLRDGVPPEPPVAAWLTVGQEELLARLDEALDEAYGGGTPIRFFDADPGCGKSHFLQVVRHKAAQRQALVSYSSQNVAARIALNNPQAVYAQVLSTFELDSVGSPNDALERVLKAWVQTALPLVAHSRPSRAMLYQLADQRLMPPVADVHKRTQVCLLGLLLAARRQDIEARRTFLDALRGAAIQNRQLAWAIEDLGGESPQLSFTPDQRDDRFWFGQLGTLIEIVQSVGVGAAAVLLDELESLVSLRNKASRKVAYRVLDAILTGEYAITGCLLLFAYTPAFLRQVHRDFDAFGPQYHRTWVEVIEKNALTIPPLDGPDVPELLDRIVDLYGRAYTFRVCLDGPIRRRLVNEWERAARSTRQLVRRTVQTLDTQSE